MGKFKNSGYTGYRRTSYRSQAGGVDSISVEVKGIEDAVASLRKFGSVVADNRQRIAALGGAYAASAAESAAPRSSAPHYRYSTAKVNRNIRAPKGMGNKVATYYPGNLGNSIRVLKFPRAKSKVYVGARLAKGQNPSGVFGRGARADGYYLHMVEEGTKNYKGRDFFVNAIKRASPRIYSIMLREWEKLTARFEQQNRV